MYEKLFDICFIVPQSHAERQTLAPLVGVFKIRASQLLRVSAV